VHKGRVDPATMYWGYDSSVKQLDIAALMVAVRDQDGLAATLDKVSPQVKQLRPRRRVARGVQGPRVEGESGSRSGAAEGSAEGSAGRELGRDTLRSRAVCAFSAISLRTRSSTGPSTRRQWWRRSRARSGDTAF
jgi:hypothetical protein